MCSESMFKDFEGEQGVVSIIVPVYKTPESVLENLLKSIASQSYKSLEVILVDDGNGASYASWLSGLLRVDERVRVAHQENMGVSSARNLGIEQAAGEFIMFADSDDELMPGCVEEAVNIMKKYRLDAVYGRYAIRDGRDEWVRTQKVGSGIRVLEGDEIEPVRICFFSHEHPKGCAAPKAVSCGPCGRVFKRSLVAECRFDTRMQMCEDAVFNAEVLSKAKRIGFVDSVWYAYCQHPFSIYHQLAFDQGFVEHFFVAGQHVGECGKFENALYAQYVHRFLYTAQLCVRRRGMKAVREVRWALRQDGCRRSFSCIDLGAFDLDGSRIALRVACRLRLATIVCLAYKVKDLVAR